MAQFTGYQCDSCGEVVSKQNRTKKRIRYEGPVFEGDIDTDLCQDCVSIPEGVDLKPIPRRKRSKDAEAAPTIVS
jgi:hypothetical protein